MTTYHFHSWFAVKTGLKEITYSISVQIKALEDSVDPFEKVITVYGWGALARNMKILCECHVSSKKSPSRVQDWDKLTNHPRWRVIYLSSRHINEYFYKKKKIVLAAIPECQSTSCPWKRRRWRLWNSRRDGPLTLNSMNCCPSWRQTEPPDPGAVEWF